MHFPDLHFFEKKNPLTRSKWLNLALDPDFFLQQFIRGKRYFTLVLKFLQLKWFPDSILHVMSCRQVPVMLQPLSVFIWVPSSSRCFQRPVLQLEFLYIAVWLYFLGTHLIVQAKKSGFLLFQCHQN